jgi:protein-L-isoaspartate O-methyltransferase
MAMRLCSRDLFVPEEYREDAFMDTPIRVEEHDFNISAPHM